MPISARNRLTGTVQSIETDGIAAEIEIKTERGELVTAVITKNSVDRLGLTEGDDVNAVIKATEVMVETT